MQEELAKSCAMTMHGISTKKIDKSSRCMSMAMDDCLIVSGMVGKKVVRWRKSLT